MCPIVSGTSGIKYTDQIPQNTRDQDECLIIYVHVRLPFPSKKALKGNEWHVVSWLGHILMSTH